MNEIELQSKTIDWLRFPLTVLVIFIHMNPAVNIQSVDYLNLNWNSLYDIVGTLISKIIGEIAVPCFFMFSGYWFFHKIKYWNRNIYFSKVQTRIRTLVIPYLLFNLTAITVHALFLILKADGSIYPYLNGLLENGWRVFWNYRHWGATTDFNVLGWALPSYSPYVYSLWFLRDLIVMALISPIVFYLVKYTRIYGLFVLGLFYYTKIWIEIPGYSSLMFLTAFFFFSLGAFFSINQKNIVTSLRQYQGFWLILAVLTLFLTTYTYGCHINIYFSPVFVLPGVISTVNITSFFMERGKLKVSKTLAKASFFVYASHLLILGFVKMVFDKIFASNNTGLDFLKYFTQPFICAGIVLCIYLAIKRFSPKLLNLFTGNR